MVYVLNVLAEVAPEWIVAHAPAEWVERYGERLEHERLPKEEEERKQYANQVGADGWMLLDAACGSCHPRLDEDAAGHLHLAHHLGTTV
jgi:hypothetical protein